MANYEKIKEHGENIKKIFGIQGDPIEISKKLRRLENKANRLAVDYANGDIDENTFISASNSILNSLNNLLRYKQKSIPVFFNSDPRGYSLKINNYYTSQLKDRGINIETDWGGYGILAPDFS